MVRIEDGNTALPSNQDSRSMVAELPELKEARDEGLLTDEEFQRKRSRIVNSDGNTTNDPPTDSSFPTSGPSQEHAKREENELASLPITEPKQENETEEDADLRPFPLST